MSDRDTKILKAAWNIFSRYGIGKTTMMDIAREANVARQTLYNAYPNKDEVLRATVRMSIENTKVSVLESWETSTTLDEKLQSFFEFVPLAWYDATQSAPDVAELVDGVHRVAKEEMRMAAEEWEAAFAELLKTHTNLSARERRELAEFLYFSAINAKYGAEDRKALERRLRILKTAFLSMVPET